jgi:hypothetical protein
MPGAVLVQIGYHGMEIITSLAEEKRFHPINIDTLTYKLATM